MKVINLYESEKNPLKPIAMERNPKKNLFAIVGKNYFKIHELKEDDKFVEVKINIKYKLNYINITWDPNKTNKIYLLANQIINSNTRRTLNPPYLYSIDLGKNIEIKDIFRFNENIFRLSMNCNENQSILACCSKDDKIYILDLKNKCIISTISKNNLGKICDCRFSPFDENLLLFSTENGKIYLYDLRNILQAKMNFSSESREILSISWNPKDPKLFCSGSMDNYIRIWDINNDISSLAEFRTSKGCSKVNFVKSNLNYIMSCYQTDNYNIDLWNLKLRDMPEYHFSGHNNNIIGIDNDVEGKRLVSCDRKGILIINEMNKGVRILDNITTNVIKINNNNEIYCFHDYKLKKENFFDIKKDNIDNKDNKYDNNNTKDNQIIQNKISEEIEVFNKESDNIKNIYMLNFNHPDLQIKKNISEKEDKIYLKSDIVLNINNELRQYYFFTKDQIHNLFRSYIYYIEKKESLYKRKRFRSQNDFAKLDSCEDMMNEKNDVDEINFSEKLTKAITENLKYAQENLNNYNHIAIWNTLSYLSNQSIFKQLYDKYSGKLEKKSKKNKKNNKKNKSFDEEKIINSNSPLSQNSIKLMTKLIINQITRIIEYLIDIYGDIYLAAIICYLFKPILFKDERVKNRVLKLIKQCVNNLRKYQLYVDANHLIKYGPEENNRFQEKNEYKFLFSCKNCGRNEFKEGKCACGKILLCEECYKKTSGLFIWCPGCGHGGHIDHINKMKSVYNCKDCEHH